MPPDIIELRTGNVWEYHVSDGRVVKDVFRPTYTYVKDVLDFLKQKTDVRKSKLDHLQLFDLLGRPYLVDMRRVFQEWTGSSAEHRHLINFTQLHDFRGSESNLHTGEKSITYFQKYRQDNLKRMREIMGKNYAIESSAEISSSKIVK